MSLLKSAATVSVFTLLSRITGLIRDMLIARYFGVSAATDAFYVAFRIPNMLRRLFAEGAFSQAFVPMLSQVKEQQPEDEQKTFISDVFSLLGCLFCFIGLGGFMAVDIGVDPWTAMAVIISKKMKKSFRIVKIVLDALTLLFGWLMGGRVGIITLFCVFVGGPIIQKSYELLDKAFDKVIKSDCKNQIKNE